MKFSLFLIALVLSSAYAFKLDEELRQQWNAYKQLHSKSYKSSDEEHFRINIWRNNLEYIKKHNAEADQGVHTYWLKANEYADMTNKEFRQAFNGFRSKMNQAPSKAAVHISNPNAELPDSVDWRTKGYVTPVKNQGQCGSCWSFSATGSLEGQHFKKTGKLVSLSEQNLVDCSQKFGNQGCNGGLMDQAFAYIKANNGIDTEASYPYKAVDGKCQFNPANVGATDTGFVDVKSKDENALQDAVANVGPISVAIDASHISFQLYSHGVYHEPLCSQTRLDHGVLAVGYGVDSGKDYWIVKNSWGATWGQQGYIWMSRGRNNNCGIATSASYPTV